VCSAKVSVQWVCSALDAKQPKNALYLSMSLCLSSLYVSIFLCLSVSLSLCRYVSLSLCLFISLYLYVSMGYTSVYEWFPDNLGKHVQVDQQRGLAVCMLVM